ncbi:glycosyltransferase [Candidatus Bathyarchaeota archaeon]|nr:MAG: glycosyltransferase [Candidatus Bathyarchaeota archaeon]
MYSLLETFLRRKPLNNLFYLTILTLYMLHGLRLIQSSLAVCRKLNVKMVVDLHENQPDAIQIWNYKPSFKQSIQRNYAWWSAYERRILSKVSNIIVVVEEMKNRLMKKGIDPEKFTVVSNTSDETYLEEESYESILNDYRDKYVVSFIGGLGPHRGVDVTIRSISLIKNEIPSLLFLVVGGGEDDYVNYLKEITKDLDLCANVKFLGHRRARAVENN